MSPHHLTLTDELASKRKEHEYEAKLIALRTAIDEGDNSGIANDGVFSRVREKLHFPADSR